MKIDPNLLPLLDESFEIVKSRLKTKGKSVSANLKTLMMNFLQKLAPVKKAMGRYGGAEEIKKRYGLDAKIRSQIRYIIGDEDSKLSRVIEDNIVFHMACLNEGGHGVESALSMSTKTINRLINRTELYIVILYKAYKFRSD